ncbi:50S ribosomal protein L22 [Patescibacteria group bacterium]|nr:50S ribosomal protein L22 [Patescibacteria group bacterium]MBU1721578.1 50S ribosomal protein L22 [Patescibacteria group bacterium]MBU1901804.1 50S ribosomal protein L22 [Patescibacteria group bacterium]
MQTKATLRNLRTSPRKVRLLIDLVRGKQVQDALLQLQFSKKSAAKSVKKLIESAIANAKHNHKIKEDSLVISTAFVDEGPTMKRWQPRAFGRAFVIRKRTSHITVVLTGEVDAVAVEKEKKEAQKEKVEKKESKKVDAPAKKAVSITKKEATKK